MDVKLHCKKWIQRKSGATLFEYAIVLALVSIIGVLLLAGIGNSTNNKLDPVTTGFQ